MATTFGGIDEFQPKNESITAYLECIDLFFAADDVAAERQVPVFLSVIEGRPYTLLRDVQAPEKPGKVSFAGLAETLWKNFEPTEVIIAERSVITDGARPLVRVCLSMSQNFRN